MTTSNLASSLQGALVIAAMFLVSMLSAEAYRWLPLQACGT